jgi:hypothetical protein
MTFGIGQITKDFTYTQAVNEIWRLIDDYAPDYDRGVKITELDKEIIMGGKNRDKGGIHAIGRGLGKLLKGVGKHWKLIAVVVVLLIAAIVGFNVFLGYVHNG